VLYFAYGSNLDAESWALWCLKKGYDPGSIEPLRPAWLPDHELVFRYESKLQKGGALDIRPRYGTAVPGALFRVHDWGGLDAKEGVPGGWYRRLSVTALTDDGRAHLATSYGVCPDRVRGFVAPAPAYKEKVMRGLSRFGHPHDGFVAAANDVTAPPNPTAIFAYGSLMSGQRSHEMLATRVRRSRGPAHVVGASLIHVDWYPGLVPSEGGEVHGELYELDDVPATLEDFDAYEDFSGYDAADSLYRRSLVSAITGGGPVLAWTYIYLGDPDAFPLIPSGRWTGA
jgi:gamma-glutamylcyclotransferase (GGCT)/AIG2-like uncharacterized protein YtfP